MKTENLKISRFIKKGNRNMKQNLGEISTNFKNAWV